MSSMTPVSLGNCQFDVELRNRSNSNVMEKYKTEFKHKKNFGSHIRTHIFVNVTLWFADFYKVQGLLKNTKNHNLRFTKNVQDFKQN